MALSVETLALSRKYTDDSIAGAGGLEGKPCQIQSITEITGGHRVTFLWVDNNGESHTSTMDVMDGADGATGPAGLGIKSVAINASGHLIVTYDDDTTEDAGEIPGGDSAITENITANVEVGGIGGGTTIESGTSLTEFAKMLLIKETAPTVTFTASGSGVKEIGTSVTPTLTLTISSAGTSDPVSIEFYSGSTLLDMQSYVSGTNTYTFTMDPISTTTTVKGVLTYKKSDNTNATVEKTAAYTFVMASYYGAVTTAPTTAGEITALTKSVKNTKAQTATFNLTNQRSCYAYPASFGDLTSIKDANNFEYLGSYTKTSVTVDGTAYNVYTLTDPVTASGFKQVYA